MDPRELIPTYEKCTQEEKKKKPVFLKPIFMGRETPEDVSQKRFVIILKTRVKFYALQDWNLAFVIY